MSTETNPGKSIKFPDVTHLLEEEIIKPNIPNEVMDFWEPPMTGQSGVPPPLTLPGIYTSVDYVSLLSMNFMQKKIKQPYLLN